MRRSLSRDERVALDGVVLRVDPVNRELAVYVDGDLVVVDVPPDCPVLLRGERVKFRLVQPRDRVRVTCTDRSNTPIATGVEVQTGL